MLAGIGRTGSNSEWGIMAAPPATISTTMVSPMTRAMPSTTAVAMPVMEAGKTTPQMVSQWVAPSASAPSFMDGDAVDGVLGNTGNGRYRHQRQQYPCVEHVEAGIQIEGVLQQRCNHHHADKTDHHGRQAFDQLDHRLENATHARR